MIKYLIAFAVVSMVPVPVSSAGQGPGGEGKHLFILSGQSNMRGPLPDAFKEAVSRVFGKDRVIVVMHAQPSQPIKRWYGNWTPPEGDGEDAKKEANGTLYDALLKRVERATAGQKLASVTYIWMQGEADAGSGWGKVYEKSFYGVLDQFKSDLELKDINYVIGRINDYWLTSKGIKDGDLVRAVQVGIGEAHANGAWVNTDDINTGVNPWGIYEVDSGHFPTPAYRVLGQRFARKACRLIDPEMNLDDGIFDAVFLDSAKGVESHLAIGRKISGTKPDPGNGRAGLASLLDGKFGGVDPKDGNWAVFPPAKEGVELTLDLGESRSVNGIGVDLLINRKANADFPKSMIVSLSDDGVVYRQAHKKGIRFFYKDSIRKKVVGKLEPQSLLMFVDTPDARARYVRVKLETISSPVFLDEIVVNPVAKSDLVRNRDQWESGSGDGR